MKVICISGKAGSGKDTAAQFMKEELESHGHRVLIIHYADLLKFMCSTYFNWDGVKDEAGRTLLQYIGTDIVRDKYPNYWTDFVAGFIEMFDDDWDCAIIPDARFPNEIDIMRERFGAVHVRVDRGRDHVRSMTSAQMEHPSEVSLDDYLPDYYITNRGTLQQLRETVNTCIKEITYAD